ncbi:MAG: AMP-binding protein [Rhodospirillaceae bacterium]|nr:AMP-binding protein [Rhodospirillaceae bacterium]
MNIAALLAKAALSFPERPAIASGVEPWSDYANFHHASGAIAHALKGRYGLKSGERVAIAMSNRPEFLECLFAIWYAGLVAVPVNAKLHPSELAYIFENSGSRACFTSPELAPAIEELSADVTLLEFVISADSDTYRALKSGDTMAYAERAPEDPAWLFYTSGTTGRPKGATLSHRNLLVMTLSYFADMDPISSHDSVMHAAPLSHGSGLYALPHIAKAANNIIPESGGFDAAEVLGLIPHYSGVTLFGAPTMIVRMMNSPAMADADTTNLKLLYYGGAPMYVADVEQALRIFGSKLEQIYGQGEAPMNISYLSREFYADREHPRYAERIASAGIARTDLEFRVVDENDKALPTGEAGEVVVRGDIVMIGYWQDPEATAAALRGGWLHTGDVGSVDEDGFLTLMDRSKDMIISGGTNIYPREIEEVLLRHDEVREASVVGRPHPEWGEEVVAFVVRREGASVAAEALDALCLDNIARFKRPKQYFFETSLPKNNYGKVMKRDLRDRLAAESDGTD